MAFQDFYSFAFGIGTQNRKGEWLEVFFPAPLFKPDGAVIERISDVLGYHGGNVNVDLDDKMITQLVNSLDDPHQKQILTAMEGSQRPRVATFIERDTELTSTPESYLKLHLLSLRHVKPNEQDLNGIFAQLPTVAWTNQGAIDPDELMELQLKTRAAGGLLEVASIDKFPKMTNYVVPGGVRIAHTARVRLGAYVGEGTTVMHEGQINFNAGAMGPNMIEGRISQGVIIDSGSDLGGGASTMGTLSGGGEIVLSIGKDCLVGANGGTGIPLGDRCTIEAGLYVTASTFVQVLDEDRNPVKVVKARELAGQSDMLFIRNSRTGMVECRISKKARQLNEALHAHN